MPRPLTRTVRHAAVTAAMTATLSTAALGVSGPAQAAPPADGCPPTYDLLEVAPLAALGYRVPGLVDSPDSGVLSFGLPGNGDGWVCAHPSGNQLTPWGTQVFNFWDNVLLTR